MIQRMSDQHRIKFTEDTLASEDNSVNKKANAESEDQKIEKLIQEQKSKKIDNSDVINTRGDKGILSAGRAASGGVTDIGGSTKYMGAETKNSIWDSEKIDKLIGSKDNGEKIREEREGLERVRNGLKQESLDNLAEALSETETRKDATVTSVGEFSGSSFKAPKNNLSIFDTNVFEDMPEKTEGEIVAENARKEKEKDDSWKDHRGTRKMSGLVDSLFENLNQDK